MVWFCDGLAFKGTGVFEVLKAASFGASMSFQSSASMSRRLPFASNVILLILLMYPV